MTAHFSSQTDHDRTRLEILLTANRAIVAELSLDTLLQLVADLAREVVGSEYAALGLLGDDGAAEQFVYSGVDEHTLAALRAMAKTTGPLSQLVRAEDSGFRLRRLADAPVSGVSAHQPLLRSFLAVAIRSSTIVYGNLYLGNRVGRASFTTEDEDLVTALAATAGIAIENARLYEESHRRQDWLRASADICRQLLAGDDNATDALSHIADAVLRLAPANLVSVVEPVPGTPEALRVTLSKGQGAAEIEEMQYSVEGSLAWQAMQSGRGIIIADAHERAGVYRQVRSILPAMHVMAIPLQGKTVAHGAIVVVRTTPTPFSDAVLEMAEGFASQATLALELAAARQDRHRLTVLEDRARIARDLHDHVVQKLFAVGLIIQCVTKSIRDPGLVQKLGVALSEIDDAIRSIRTAIHQLQEPRSNLGSPRSRLSSVIADLTPMLGFSPTVQFEGPLDTVVDEGLTTEVEVVLREAFSDIAKHAEARSVTVRLTTDGRQFVATIIDDDAHTVGRSQMAGLRQRAEHRGGGLEISYTEWTRETRWTALV